MRVSELARRLGVRWEGEDVEIGAAASLEAAGPGDLAFVGNRKSRAEALASRAGCLVAPEDFPAGRTVLRAGDPRLVFARSIPLLHPHPAAPAGVASSASIAPDAVLGEGVSLGPHTTVGNGSSIGAGTVVGAGSTIGAGVKIGAGCVLHANVTVYERVTVGDRAVLHSGCVLGADGFGFVQSGGRYEKFPQIGVVEIGDDVEIGANSCVDRAALGATRIGNGVKIDNLVHVGHNCRIGDHVVIAAQTGLSGGVVIEDYAVIGGQVGIGDHARIESRAVLGSGSGILTSKIVRGGQVVWGTPARPLKQYLEQLAHLARLPKLHDELRELRDKLAALAARVDRAK